MSTNSAEQTAAETHRPKGLLNRARNGLRCLNANKKRFFWWWVAYQAVKGMITLTLIWIPLWLLWWRG